MLRNQLEVKMSNVLQYRFGKKQKRESFFKLSSLLNSLKTVVTVQRCVKMKRFVSFFQSFTDFYFFSPSKYVNFRNGCVLDDFITFDYGIPFMFLRRY